MTAEGPPWASTIIRVGGEMSRLIIERDWSDTELGPIEHWPPHLRAAVAMMLVSKAQIVMFWGTNLAMLYNDAYIPVLGSKHPALGQPAQVSWSELYPELGMLLDQVVTTGEAFWERDRVFFVARHGYLEEAYFDLSWDPVHNSDGTVAGVYVVVNETTARVLGDRRLRVLRELGARTAGEQTVAEVAAAAVRVLDEDAKDVPFSLLYLLDEADSRQIARLVALSGLAPDSILVPRDVELPWSSGTAGPWAGSGPGAHAVAEVIRRGTAASVPVAHLVSTAPDLAAGSALALPLASRARTAGILVVGVSKHLALGGAYRDFLDLVAGRVSSALAAVRALEDERERAEALRQLDEAKTVFFSNISHEFRTPLTLISGPVEDSLRDAADPLSAGQRARLEIVRRNAGRLHRLVNNVLEFSRLEAGRQSAETVATELASATRGIAESFEPAVQRNGLRLIVDCPSLRRIVYVDIDMWEKIVLNLLSNALKYTPHGEIRISLRATGDYIELTVADTGVGIPEDQLPLLFQRFQRIRGGEPGRSHEGTGIGLALVHELVALHDGSVSVSSHEGTGSTFTVRLPFGTMATGTMATGAVPTHRESAAQLYVDEALQWAPRQDPADQYGVTPLSDADRGGETTILVADDNPDVRSYITELLRPHWRVLVARDGAEALTVALARLPDLVLTDIMMPRMDGFGLLTALRANPVTAAIPVVFFSARAGEEAAIEGLDAGADDYLVKPFSSMELVARVRANLELARLRRRESAWRKALVTSLGQGVVVADSTATVVEVNDAFTRILGFDQQGIPYRPPYPWWPDPVRDPDGRAQVEAALESVLTESSGYFVLPMRHQDGHRVWVEITVSSVTDPAQVQPMLVGVLRDVTAERAAEQRRAALARLTARLSSAQDSASVIEAGIAELTAVFGASVAIVQAQESCEPHPERTGGADRVRGIAAPIDCAQRRAVWLEFDPPRPFTLDERSLLALLCGFLGQALDRAQMFDQQRTVAATLQRAILGPTDLPAGLATRYVPAVRPLDVGGDWYDVVELPGQRMALVVGDCVGSGLDAAAVMGQLRSACRALLFVAGSSPATVLTALDAFATRIPDALCASVFCALVDTADGSMVYSCAGHPPAVIVHPDGRSELLDGARFAPLAVVPAAVRPEASTRLRPGSTLLLYTDGLVERRHERLDVSITRLRETLVAHRTAPPDHLADRLLQTLLPSGGQQDDVALLIYQRPGPTPRFTPTKLAGVPAGLSLS